MIPIVDNKEEDKFFSFYQWGLIPAWSRDEEIGLRMFNARAETIDEKPSFRGPFKHKRCLVPADGFFEWDKSHNPFRFTLKDDEPFAFAGLCETWEHDGRTINTFTIITTKANGLIEDIHDRMPVILRREDEADWLDQELNLEAAKQMLKPYPDKKMVFYPVDKLVNLAKNDSPEVIKPKE
jgi:putative SOS response-associated peptidase YedK